MSAQPWLTQRERGSTRLLRFIIWIALHLGRPAGRALLYPICLYFVLFSIHTRRASRKYLTRIRGKQASLLSIFRHYHVFSATILDRVFFLSGRFDEFNVTVHGADCLMAYVDKGQGCVLLGAHVGSFDALRVFGKAHRNLLIRVLLYEANARKISSVFNALNPEIAETVISVGSLNAMLAVQESIAAGGLIGIMGDRAMPGERTVCCRFLGEEAVFPSGPLSLASVLKVPVILCFGLYRGGRDYELHFELLTEKLTLGRAQREQDLREWAQRYADRVEHYCRLAPYNWFNFYDFWDKEHAR